MEKLINILTTLFETAFESCGYNKEYGTVTVSNRPDLCQFQCNGALPAAKNIKLLPNR